MIRRRNFRLQQQQQQADESRSSRHHHHSHHNHHHHHHHSSQRRASRIQLDSPQVIGTDWSNHQEDTVPCRVRLPFLLLRRRTDTDAHRVALEARGRLDERLREAALLGRRNGENTLPRLAQHYFNALFSNEDEENLLLEDDHEVEIRLREWLAGNVTGFRENRFAGNSWSESSSTNRGLSKSAAKALPREIYGQRKSYKTQAGREQVDCSVCLEAFSSGQILLCLPCEHKFHQACLTPWLDHHDQCPYCRAEIQIRKLDLKPQNSSQATAAASSNAEDNLLSWLEAFETGTVLSRTS